MGRLMPGWAWSLGRLAQGWSWPDGRLGKSSAGLRRRIVWAMECAAGQAGVGERP
ncbi:hypothetical protein ACIBO2_39685 [Nonomuraea sp. NPDC050022]|uniref:hypothetical protein n=1 Tax=Nonomuraea sp. NPDC050022 TaxID=3364358 RepID=UPI0037A87BBF